MPTRKNDFESFISSSARHKEVQIDLSTFRPGCLIEVWLRGRLDPDDARPVPEVGERVCLAAENFAMEEMGRQPLKERQYLYDVRKIT